MAWKVDFHPHALKDLTRLDRLAQQRILGFLRERIQTEESPRRLGGSLHGTTGDLWKYRIGDQRLICDTQHGKALVLCIGLRKEV